MNIDEILIKQKTFFHTGSTLTTEFRVDMLKKLRDSIKKHNAEILSALKSDLGKSDYESTMCETGMAISEISYMIKHTKKYATPVKVRTGVSNFAAKSFVLPVPYGNVLIMSPWNYPFLLSVAPLCNAIAAGNTAIVKPSAYSPETAGIVAKIIGECFDEEYVAVVTGGRKENAELLNKKYDLVFFTGSQNVGKEVLRHTAETLTPAVLELGGKSPCIVDESADIALAARRIVFGKFLNCGQTCVAPDHILCDKRIKDELIKELCAQIKEQYGEDALKNADYGRIINKKHFDRLLGLMDKSKVVYGGEYSESTMQIAPTVMAGVTFEDAVMKEEIFGPILPVLTYERFDDIYEILKDSPKPLALYIFSHDKERINGITSRVRFGGGCINDVIVHLATSEMGFGGVGESGMGSYHGKAGFDAFSHRKSILDKKTWVDLRMRYQPYNRKKYSKLIGMFLK